MTSQYNEMSIHPLTGEPLFLMRSCDLALTKGKEQIAEELQASGYDPEAAKTRAQEIIAQARLDRAAQSPAPTRSTLDTL